VPVQIAAGQAHETVHLIDWEHPSMNDFALAEAVTLKGGYQRRPDIVLYLNGLAVAVIELERSSVELADGVRQLITNQDEIFDKGFFSMVQLVLAGNDSQGLRYGTNGTSDMRHLLDTYIQADASEVLGALDQVPLTELIIQTGIHDAIARKLNEKGRLSRNAVAEGIIDNVRKTIVREQLADPRFYERMSTLLDDLIQQSLADTAAHEAFLRKAEDLVKRLASKHAQDGVPAALHGRREATVIYND